MSFSGKDPPLTALSVSCSRLRSGSAAILVQPLRVRTVSATVFSWKKNRDRGVQTIVGALSRIFLEADVTLGRATAFARRVERWVGFSKTPAQAFRKAIDELSRCSTVNEKIAIPPDSLDLVTSSMVVSQFDHEPYTFFSKLLALQFGSRLLAEEARLLL